MTLTLIGMMTSCKLLKPIQVALEHRKVLGLGQRIVHLGRIGCCRRA